MPAWRRRRRGAAFSLLPPPTEESRLDPGQGRPAGLLGLLVSAVLRLLGVGWISLRFVVGLLALLARGVPEIVG